MTSYSDLITGGQAGVSPPTLQGQWGPLATASRSLGDKLSDLISVKDFGAKGDSVANDTAALQSAINSGRALWLPAGVYRTEPLTYTAASPLILIGEFNWEAVAATTQILGLVDTNDAQPLISRVEGYMRTDGTFSQGPGGVSTIFPGYVYAIIKNIQIRVPNGNAIGACLEIGNSRSVHIEQCRLRAPFRGLTLTGANFDTTVMNIKVSSSFGQNHDWQVKADREIAKFAWGVRTDGHTALINIMAQGCGTGISIGDVGNTINTARLESCGYGLLIGAAPGGPLTRSGISGVSTEACGYGIYVEDMVATKIVGAGSQGTVTQSWPQSFAGLYVNKASESSRIECYEAGQNFQHAAVINNSRIPIYHYNGGNALAPNIAFGGQNTPLLTGPNNDKSEPTYHFFHTNMFPNAVKRRHATMTAFHDLMLPGLTGLNIRDRATSGTAEGGPAFAKNLGGVATPANAASTAAVTFLVSRGAGQVAISNIAAQADITSTLEAGTYYYATTVVGPHGETPGNFSDTSSIEVAAEQKVVMSFFNTGSAPGYRRRVYRGRSPGVFEGCYEYASIDDHSAFEDDGSIAYALKQMPGNGLRAIPSREEDDAHYQIVATPSWATTVHATNKATTGFTLNFGTPAPDGNQTVAWLLFRP